MVQRWTSRLLIGTVLVSGAIAAGAGSAGAAPIVEITTPVLGISVLPPQPPDDTPPAPDVPPVDPDGPGAGDVVPQLNVGEEFAWPNGLTMSVTAIRGELPLEPHDQVGFTREVSVDLRLTNTGDTELRGGPYALTLTSDLGETTPTGPASGMITVPPHQSVEWSQHFLLTADALSDLDVQVIDQSIPDGPTAVFRGTA
ncbi:hypothetical protein [Amycolatopsis sp. GM8]|uniref:hypothetical protein n=1 Tax=Amycolatopsis sp. GM8 TaxID=2896530 RepID=UPI001F157B00|nr:hypothetical protein [Amycolatopsis sp. GM8]